MPQWDPHNVVVITGASSGIGRAVALKYAARKCTLVLAARKRKALEEVEREVKKLGCVVRIVVCDVTREKECKELMEKTFYEFGRLDVLVLNAGVGLHHFFDKSTDLDVYKKLMDVNFFGYLFCTRYAFEYLKKSKGTIIVVSSVSGEMGLPYRTAYCASKFAVTGFFEALRTELDVTSQDENNKKSPIHITIVCPPTVATNLRKNSLTTDPSFSHINDKEAFTAPQVAHVIVDAADRKLRKVYFPLNAFLGVYARPFLPDVVDYFAKKKAKL